MTIADMQTATSQLADSMGEFEEGKRYLFSFLFIDRVKSTEDHKFYDESEVQRRAKVFHDIVEDKIHLFNGRRDTWVGDATTAFFHFAQPESTLARARTLAARGRSPIFTKHTGTPQSGDLGSQIVSDRVLGGDARSLGRAVAPTE